MDSGATNLIFEQRDGLAMAKLLAVFCLHAGSLGLLFHIAKGQPQSTLGRMSLISASSTLRIMTAAAIAGLITLASLIADQHAGRNHRGQRKQNEEYDRSSPPPSRGGLLRITHRHPGRVPELSRPDGAYREATPDTGPA